MEFSITYDATTIDGSLSVSDYLTQWAASYNEVYYCHAEAQFNTYGGFWSTNANPCCAAEYNISYTINGMTAVVSDGMWGYDAETDTFTDILNTLHFGECLSLAAETGYYLASEAVTFEGLADIISDPFYVNYFLLSGDISELLNQMESAGIDTMASLDSYAPMTETDESAPMVDTTGVQDNSDTLMAA